MSTVIVRMAIDPARLDEVDRHFEQDVVPWAKQQTGFVGGRWLRSADGTQGLGIMVYESAEAAEAAAQGPRRYASADGRAWNIVEVTLFDQVTEQ